MSRWQPIESAPKDGTLVLAVVDGYVASIVSWQTHGGTSRWARDPEDFNAEDEFYDYFYQTRYEPTHWMPLPKSPRLETKVECDCVDYCNGPDTTDRQCRAENGTF